LFQALTLDGWLLFVTRCIRLFAYGALSVILVLYLTSLGLTEPQTGTILTLTLAGDAVASLVLTTRADRIGRRRMLIIGPLLMAGAGVLFATTKNLLVLAIAGTIGVISPSGNEVGSYQSSKPPSRRSSPIDAGRPRLPGIHWRAQRRRLSAPYAGAPFRTCSGPTTRYRHRHTGLWCFSTLLWALR
jgi:hypothetical protein